MQPPFSKFKLFSSLTVALPIFGLAVWLKGQPNRWPGPDRTVFGQAQRVAAGPGLTAWRLTAPDPRFGGLSALAIDRGALVALTDSGVVVRFAPPVAGGTVRFALRDLPGGPGSARRKSMRDSESLLADRASGGWWVAFENRHSLFLFDRAFRRVLGGQRLKVGWGHNFGGEALVARAGGVMVLPELGGAAWGGPMVAPAWTSDATRLPDGRLALIVRRPTWRGFDNRVSIGAGAGKAARRIAIRLRPLDNVEGIAAAPLPDGGTRLWLVSDDNFRPWMRTLLVRIDLAPGI